MKSIAISFLLLFIAFGISEAQINPAKPAVGDTLIIEVGQSKFMLIVNDLDDLEKIQQYDLNKIIQRLQGERGQDSTIVLSLREVQEQQVTEDTVKIGEADPARETHKTKFRHYQHVINIDLGMNNYLSNGKFPDQSNAPYTVRPWGSWYIALGSVNQFKFTRSFMIEGGLGLSWYNFKFENDAIFMGNDDSGVTFNENPDALDADFIKSKLTVAYLNASIVPVFRIGPGGSARFRFGIGAYAGYRLGSYNKVKYELESKEKDKNHDPFHLNDFRYGVRLQAGFKGTDLFFNYDLNKLFASNRGPELNAFSFGIIL